MIPTYDPPIQYLKELKNKLEVLKMADNPFTKYNEAEYKQYAIAWLKDLKYLDYELIDEEAREKANEKYKEEIADKENIKTAEKKDEV